MPFARKSRLQLTIEGVDVSRDIAPFLTSFEYVDSPSGETDEIQIELDDRDGRFRGDWLPSRKAEIRAKIVVTDWKKEGGGDSLDCGLFQIDEIEVSGPPGTASIKGVSVPLTSNGRREQTTKAWEEITLKEMADAAAAASNLKLAYETLINPLWKRIEQREESPLAFLGRLAERAGLCVKAVNNKLAIFDANANAVSASIDRNGGGVLSWSFRTQSGDTYKSCEVSYRNASEKSFVKGLARGQLEDGGEDGPVLKFNTRVESQEEADRIAENALKQANRREVTGELSLLGDPSLLVGTKLSLSGFGAFDGTYHIARSTHSINSSGGYTTSVELDDGKAKVGGSKTRKDNKPSWADKLAT